MSNYSILSSCKLLSVDSSKAHQLLTDAERELESLISGKEKTDSDVLEIFNVNGFGAEGEWKKLDGTCLEKDTGECVSFFDLSPIPSYLGSVATHMKYASSRKPNKSQIMAELRSASGQYFKQVICHGLPLTYGLSLLPYCYFLLLRRFDSWNPSSDVKPGHPEYYQKQVYKYGTRCWNGPERNLIVSLNIPSRL